MLGFLSLGLIWFFWINLVFWFNLGFITLEGVVFPPMAVQRRIEFALYPFFRFLIWAKKIFFY